MLPKINFDSKMLGRSVNDPAATTQQAATTPVRLEPMRPGQIHEARPRDKINKETRKLP